MHYENQKDIYAGLTEVFRDVFEDESLVLRPDLRASDIEGWDSARHITLIVAAEGHFGIRFSSAELESLGSVGDLVTRISAKVKA
jgi:acyl carrier protein